MVGEGVACKRISKKGKKKVIPFLSGVRYRVTHFTSLCLSFIPCKIGIIIQILPPS